MLTGTRVRSKGVSLIELMVVVTIVTAIAAFGLPSFVAWVQNTQIRTAAEGVLNGLQLARVEAVRRNANVEFILTSPGTMGGTGWSVQLVDGTVLQSKTSGEGSANVTLAVTPASATKITFGGFGRDVANNGGTDSIDVVDVDIASFSSSDKRALRIEIVNGQPRMCDPSVSASGDPRKC